jgi:aminotransferase
MKSLARRTENLAQSDIRAVSHAVEAVDGINLGQGICDLPTPEPIKAAARQAIADNKSVYTSHEGLASLREKILEKIQSFNRLPATDAGEVMVSAGATGAYTAAILALCDAGDEVILFEPFYGYHRNLLEIIGVAPQYVTTEAPDWSIDFDALEETITKRTKAVVVNTPANPTGKVWSRGELQQLVDVLEAHDLYAITDEIYEYMTYDGQEHLSLAALPGAYERTITISGFSKTYNMTGWRLGYAVGPRPLIEPMGLLNDLVYVCAPTPLQHGVEAAFSMDEQYFDNLLNDYRRRRTLMCTTLQEIGFDAPLPEGAYYAMANFEDLSGRIDGFENARQASQTLIEEAGVAAVPGPSFFEDPADGRYYLRFCFAKEIDVLNQACRQLLDAFG